MPSDVVRHAAHQQAPERPAVVRADQDDIDGLGDGRFDDRLARLTRLHEERHRYADRPASGDESLRDRLPSITNLIDAGDKASTGDR